VSAASKNLVWLLWTRGFRSFATAFLTVIFPLYLARLGYSAATIGFILAVSGFVTVVLVAWVGYVGDRWGRKPILVGLGLLAAIGGLGLTWSGAVWVAILASGLGGIGRGGGAGSGGSWGPVFPAEQPLVADSVPLARRTYAFGQLSFVGVLAGAVGSLVAVVPAVLHAQGWPWLPAYRVLFGFSALVSLGMVGLALKIQEPPLRPPQAEDSAPFSLAQLVGRLGLTNALNGLGFGFLGPLLTYWFYRRFGVGPKELGVLYTVVNLAAAWPYLWSANLQARWGAVRTVVFTRAVSLVMLAGMIWAGRFWIAGALYTLRMVFNSLGMPARQSYVMGVSAQHYRSRAAAWGSLPSQVTAMISPAIAGATMDSFLDVPIVGAVVFMGLNLVTYYWAFRRVSSPDDRVSRSGQGG
jgi:MFS family permease